jgi:hypothetical protein
VRDFVSGLERDLVAAAARRSARARGRSLRTLPLVAAIFVLVGASAAAGTLTVLRGSPIPAPREENAGPSQTPVPGSSRIAPMRAADPGGGPPWALRVARSRTGLVCSTVGQVVDGEFGLVGLDGRFREFSERSVDGCGRTRRNTVSLAGERVLYARRAADVRTVVNGFAGPTLRAAEVEAGGTKHPVPVSADGEFVHALRGYPEDVGVRLRLRFADGHVENYPFGTDAQVIVDPLGGPAWKTQGAQFDGAEPVCVTFQPARERRNMPVSPAACGIADVRRPRGYWFAVRRLTRTRGATTLERGRWVGPPRTAVWGSVGEDVRGVAVAGPGGRRELTIIPGRRFLAIFPASVDPSSLRVELTMRDGRVRVERGDTNLVPPTRSG